MERMPISAIDPRVRLVTMLSSGNLLFAIRFRPTATASTKPGSRFADNGVLYRVIEKGREAVEFSLIAKAILPQDVERPSHVILGKERDGAANILPSAG